MQQNTLEKRFGAEMTDKQVSQTLKKVFPRERPPLVIEKISKTQRYVGGWSHTDNGQRDIIMSLPRVKWLERPDVG